MHSRRKRYPNYHQRGGIAPTLVYAREGYIPIPSCNEYAESCRSSSLGLQLAPGRQVEIGPPSLAICRSWSLGLQLAPGRQVAIGPPSLAICRSWSLGLQLAPGRQVAIGPPSLAICRSWSLGLQLAPGRQVAIGPPSLAVLGLGSSLPNEVLTPWEATENANSIISTGTYEYFFMTFLLRVSRLRLRELLVSRLRVAGIFSCRWREPRRGCSIADQGSVTA